MGRGDVYFVIEACLLGDVCAVGALLPLDVLGDGIGFFSRLFERIGMAHSGEDSSCPSHKGFVFYAGIGVEEDAFMRRA